MVRKSQEKTSGKQKGPGRIKNLKLKKQTVRDLSIEDLKQVKGGGVGETGASCHKCEAY